MGEEPDKELQSLWGEGFGSWNEEDRENQATSLGSLLSKLSNEGTRVDAEDDFTLNEEKALAKLHAYRLPTAAEAVVPLFASAVASGATEVSFEGGPEGFTFAHDGAGFSENQVHNLLPSLLSTRTPPALKELALALNSLLGSKRKTLVFESWGEQGCYRMDLIRGRTPAVFEPPLEAGPRGQRIISTAGRGWGRSVLRRLTGDPALLALQRRCPYPPIRLFWNGQELDGVRQERIDSYLLWQHPKHRIGEELLDPKSGFVERSPGNFSMLLAIGPKEGLICNVHGVSYPVPATIDPRGLFVILARDNAERDITFQVLQEQGQQLWSEHSRMIGVGLKRLVDLTRKHQIMAGDPQEQERWSQALRRVPHVLSSALAQPAIYRTSEGVPATLDSLQGQRQVLGEILYTEKEWKYPLRDGRTVFVLSAEEREQIWGLRCADEELASSQVYFEKKSQWEKLPSEIPRGPETRNGVVKELTTLKGQIGLTDYYIQKGKLYPFKRGKPLPVTPWDELPSGCWLMVENDRFKVNDLWSAVSWPGMERSMKALLENDLFQFYSELVEKSPAYNTHILSFLVHLRKRRGPWSRLFAKMAFRRPKFAGLYGHGKSPTLEQQYYLSPDIPTRNIQGFDVAVQTGNLYSFVSILTREMYVSPLEKALLNDLSSAEFWNSTEH
ncbi:MAG: hypothetical protein WC314_11905 [Vulcanimicrobiota bacterium]